MHISTKEDVTSEEGKNYTVSPLKCVLQPKCEKGLFAFWFEVYLGGIFSFLNLKFQKYIGSLANRDHISCMVGGYAIRLSFR